MGYYYSYSNYSNGWVIEKVKDGEEPCESWLLLPAENLWSVGVRAFLYILAMVYIFMGIAIASDVFMGAIEVITSQKKTVVRWDEERQERIEKEVLLWNETVANLTLMALGSSAPEILLAVLETVTNLGVDKKLDGLGTFTIIGSAAFNLLIITAVCIISVPSPDVKKVRELGVFALTSIWSIFAYIWMLIVVQFVSPGEVEPWEAWVTLAFFPVMVLSAYCQDSGWWCSKCNRSSAVDAMQQSQVNVRVVTDTRRHSILHGPSKELQLLEREKTMRQSQMNLKSLEDLKGFDNTKGSEAGSLMGSQARLMKQRNQTTTVSSNIARARFRHAAVRSMMGGKRKPVVTVLHQKNKVAMAEVVEDVVKKNSLQEHRGTGVEDDLLGKFTFASASYSVLESAGIIEINVLFHRRRPSKEKPKAMNGGMNGNGVAPHSETETSFSLSNEHNGVVSIDFETREGSGKIDKDFKYAQGTLIFMETEYQKTITVPIINDNQYEADVDFYVILKNATGDSGIGDPSIARVTIIDDDEPGEFQFEELHYYADRAQGMVIINVIRQKGCDGTVTVEYSTIDGTAKGGAAIAAGVDFKRADGTLKFKHGETSQKIFVEVNKETRGSKNFIVTLRNPSLGAKIGDNSATMANITSDDLAERIAEVLDDDEEELTWGGQFRNAMVLESDVDEDGREIPLKWYHYLLHFLSFLWKVIFACVPPRCYLGAYPTFIVSLGMIGLLTALVEQLGSLLGCVIGLKASVAGITIVALGTSLPDTFASRTAALHDEGADAAIGNVTGSNSVNVFLGLGLPWVINAMYALAHNKRFMVDTNDLVSSVVIFTICGTLCIILLLFRRKLVGGELGGANPVVKYSCFTFLVCLWLTYITLSSVQAYHPDAFPW